MAESLYALAFLACPVGMGLMMWMMMRGNKNQTAADDASMGKQAELARMQAQIDQLRADKDRAAAKPVRQPAP
jgi:hypothetical protein